MAARQELKTLYHCVYNLQYHLVLVTKYRRKCITTAMLARLREILAATTAKWGGELIECNGEADHVHLLISLSPTIQLSTFVNNLKTVSSRLIRKEFGRELARWYRKPVFWSRSYCVISCGGAPLSVLRQYIEQQHGAE
ncbi:MAG: IS200/IS605 family transposase [Nitrospinae bacterium]|nr:IS200/IS605 family transposase [Nitrospinota bacterium]